MGILRVFSALSPVYMYVFSWFSRGKYVGSDVYGNKYYSGAARPGYQYNRRWVMYKDVPEASAVPPEWHGWLHHQTDTVPDENAESFRRPWQKPHQPNLTGTTATYLPPGHLLKGGRRDKATGDYEAWKPSE